MKRLLQVLLMCVLLALAIPAAADVTLGLPASTNSNNCYPFGCAYSGEYQQVYNHSQFPGTITITNLEFFNTVLNLDATAMNSGNWAISLSTTSADWNTLSTNFSSNIGTNNTLVFSGNLSQPWAFEDTLDITLSTPFTYDPSNGNLLMDVVATGTTDLGGIIPFDVNGDNTYMSRAFNTGGVPSGSVDVTGGYGLVTKFSTGSTPTPAPEPTTMLLLGLGLVGLAGVRRKFKQ
jgi:hypothetical protein